MVRRLCNKGTGQVPVFIMRKKLVPQVFLACPGWKAVCPNSATCWSPCNPKRGTLEKVSWCDSCLQDGSIAPKDQEILVLIYGTGQSICNELDDVGFLAMGSTVMGWSEA